MTRISIYIILSLLIGSSCVYAQIDTLNFIQSIDVEGFKVRAGSVGGHVQKFEAFEIEELQHTSVSDVLQRKSNVYVKSYGGNSLSTLSIRGASGSQNLVTWNGLPVQSSMLGLLDLSLIPISLVDEIQLEAGGNSSSWGSGAIGGVLSFNQKTSFNNKVQVNYASSLGSFGNLHQGLNVQFGNKLFQSRSQIVYQKTKNDIIFKADPSLPSQRQENAAFEQMALLQTFALRPNEYNSITLHVWLQKSYKEIPPTLAQLKSEAFQTDRFKRFMGSYRFVKAKSDFKIKGAIFKEDQNFQDPQILIDANNDFTNYLVELAYKYQISRKHGVELTNTNMLTRALSNSYEKIESLDRYGLSFAYKFKSKQVDVQLSIREEVANGKFLLPVGYAGLEYRISENFALKTKLTRDFRLPTLNDLYWSPGGNIDLLPEQGWSQEIGGVFDGAFGKHKVSIGQNFFNRNIEDWILWAPSVNNYWEPTNITKVWSWGSESSFAYSFTNKKLCLKYKGMFNYISSTYRSALALPKIEIGDQLLYTPKIQFNNLVQIGLGIWHLRYEHLFVGETQAVNGALEPYNVANLNTSWIIQDKNVRTRLFLTVNNIFNQRYIVVERRPSPGINFQIGMQLNFKK